jgi:4-azaleucine resistance transporter AzlC
MTKKTFFSIVKITSPVFFGYIAIGIPFGLMLVNAGYALWFAPLMSVVMFAGSGQYMAVGLFASGAQLPVILLAMFLLNIRHCVYGLSLLEPFRAVGKWKGYVIFALSDETYALMCAHQKPAGVSAGSFYGLIALLDHLYWIFGCVLGAILGETVPFSFRGVDFALTALFAVLLLEQIKKTKTLVPPLIGIVASALALVLAPDEHFLLVSLALALTLLGILKGREKNHAL